MFLSDAALEFLCGDGFHVVSLYLAKDSMPPLEGVDTLMLPIYLRTTVRLRDRERSTSASKGMQPNPERIDGIARQVLAEAVEKGLPKGMTLPIATRAFNAWMCDILKPASSGGQNERERCIYAIITNALERLGVLNVDRARKLITATARRHGFGIAPRDVNAMVLSELWSEREQPFYFVDGSGEYIPDVRGIRDLLREHRGRHAGMGDADIEEAAEDETQSILEVVAQAEECLAAHARVADLYREFESKGDAPALAALDWLLADDLSRAEAASRRGVKEYQVRSAESRVEMQLRRLG